MVTCPSPIPIPLPFQGCEWGRTLCQGQGERATLNPRPMAARRDQRSMGGGESRGARGSSGHHRAYNWAPRSITSPVAEGFLEEVAFKLRSK